MTEFRFNPPLTLKGNVVVRNLDDAVRFMIGYREARRPALQTSVLYRLREPPAKQTSAMPETHFAPAPLLRAAVQSGNAQKAALGQFDIMTYSNSF